MNDTFNSGLITGLAMHPLPVAQVSVIKKEIIEQKAGIVDTVYIGHPKEYISDSVLGIDSFTRAYKSRCNAWQEANHDAKVATSLTAKASEPCLLIAAVMHRDSNITIDGDGWTRVATSQKAAYSNVSQWITVFTKAVSKGDYRVTVKQTKSIQMSLKLFAICDTDGITLVDNALALNKTITPSPKSGKKRLYFLSCVYQPNTSAIPMIAIESGGEVVHRMLKFDEKLFSAFYDFVDTSDLVPTFKYNDNSSYNANSINMLSFDVN